jgi:hypothetical protein
MPPSTQGRHHHLRTAGELGDQGRRLEDARTDDDAHDQRHGVLQVENRLGCRVGKDEFRLLLLLCAHRACRSWLNDCLQWQTRSAARPGRLWAGGYDQGRQMFVLCSCNFLRPVCCAVPDPGNHWTPWITPGHRAGSPNRSRIVLRQTRWFKPDKPTDNGSGWRT